MAVLADAEIILPLAGLIDKEAEAARHRKTLADLDKQLGGDPGEARQRGVRRAGPRPRSSSSSGPRRPSWSPSARRSRPLLGEG